MNPEEGDGWSRQQADSEEQGYRKYLFLCAINPGMTIVPSKNVDKFWHAHILDTMKYAEDCEMLFGSFLHHFPYLGLRGKEDALALRTAYKNTQILLREHFGDEAADRKDDDGGSKCGSSCGAGYCAASCSKTFTAQE